MITVWRRMPIPAFALVVVIVLISIGFVSAANLSVSPVSKLTASSNTGISITNPPVSTCTLRTANNDSYVDQSASSSTHDAGSLRVQSDDGGIFSGDDNERAFVAFAESPCDESGQGMEAGVAVISAALQLYMFNAPGVNLTYAAHRVTGASWTEGALTWSNQPAVAGSPSSSVATGTTANVWKSWDVTADVRLIVGGTPNYGWRISDSVESSSNLTNAYFCDREITSGSCNSSLVPRVVITYQPSVDTCTLRATDDNYNASGSTVQGNIYDNHANQLQVAESSTPNTSGSDRNHVFVKFNLAGTCGETGQAIPSGSKIVSSSFDLFKFAVPSSTRTYNLYRVLATWNESGAGAPTWTWDNTGGNVSGTVAASASITTTNNLWVSWDVTNEVAAFVGGSATNYGWKVADSSENDAGHILAKFCQTEGGGSCATSGNSDDRPRLVVLFDRPYP